MTNSPDEVTFLVHGSRCSNWTNPRTTDEWLAAQLVEDEVAEGDWDGGEPSARSVWRCPLCKVAVYVMLDGGAIDFGIEHPRPVQKAIFIETFESIVRKKPDDFPQP